MRTCYIRISDVDNVTLIAFLVSRDDRVFVSLCVSVSFWKCKGDCVVSKLRSCYLALACS